MVRIHQDSVHVLFLKKVLLFWIDFFFEFCFLLIGPTGIPYHAVPEREGGRPHSSAQLVPSASPDFMMQSLRCGLGTTTFLVFYRLYFRLENGTKSL